MRSRRQRLGQHFLRDEQIARAIVSALPAVPGRVLEIGPGRGDLTRVLVERFPRVRAVELDATLAARLRSQVSSPSHLEVVDGDALTIDLDEVTGGERWLVAANLPYAVGTPILRRLLRRRDLFPALVVMLQREVAERLVARPGDRRRGLLTLEIELAGTAELILRVPPHAFSPPPKVDSAVVRILVPEQAPMEATGVRALALASRAFTQRRKKLANALASVAARERVAAALLASGLGEGVRAEHLSCEDWLALAEELPKEAR